MNNRSIVKERFDGINKIFFVCCRAYYIIHNLHFPENEAKDIIKKSVFLSFSRYTYYYMLIIELHKLFFDDCNNKLSFHKFLNDLKNQKKASRNISLINSIEY